MTVTGANSAVIATTSYVPPYKYVTSFAPLPSVTGSVTGSGLGSVTNSQGNPANTAYASSVEFSTTYLQNHVMSNPSYRYTYLLWIALALIGLLYAAAHHLRLSGGSLGAVYARWAMRRKTLGSKKPGSRAGRILPSNGLLLMLVLIVVISCVLCVVGPDYIAPSTSVFNLGSSRKRDSAPTSTISKAFWTSGSRFGDIAFALTPLVVLLALKSPPVALLANRAFAQLYSDKLAILHRAAAWLVWLLTTVHVALWTVQLFEDRNNGSAAWVAMWTNYRFICGAVSYFAMTAVMVLSIRPIRKKQYEFFYIAHVFFVILTIGAAAVHHPPLWYWMAAAAALWGAERLFRFMRLLRINGLKGRKRDARFVAGHPYNGIPVNTPQNAYGMQDIKQPADLYDMPYTDKSLPRAPRALSPGAQLYAPGWPRTDTSEIENEFGGRAGPGYYDEGSLQPLGTYDSRYDHIYQNDGRATPGSATLYSQGSQQGYFPNSKEGQHTRNRSSIAPSLGPSIVPPPVPIGFAQAQLLPSRTVRLTIKVPHLFKWAPGQNVLLYLPDLSRFQSHPFTITNNGESEIILLVKARKGITRKLYELVRQRSHNALGIQAKEKRVSLASMRSASGVQMPPIHVRALVDGPLGSSCRVRWGEYSTILIICGGSGVSFGAAICDFACRRIHEAQARPSKGWRTERVRFCWVAREYAEIAWVANQLRRCQVLVGAAQLEISIFVTNSARKATADEFLAPQPGFARHQRRDSQDSITSDLSVASPSDDGPIDLDGETVESHGAPHSYADIIDLTNYEDEEDVHDPAEHQLSERLQQQGKMRRAKSRRTARGPKASNGAKSPTYPPHRRQQSTLPYADSEAEGQYAAGQGGYSETQYAGGARGEYHSEPYNDQRPPADNRGYLHSASQQSLHPHLSQPNPGFAAGSRSVSYTSLSGSTYGRYDPFAGGSNDMRGASPNPSMFFGGDDAQSVAGESVHNLLSRMSRSGSMVLLENNGADPTGDEALWIDQSDHAAMNVIAETARSGKPKLASVLEEEIQRAQGSMIVATCGPITLNTVVRSLVSRHISPARIRHGDKRGHIAIYSEDYES